MLPGIAGQINFGLALPNFVILWSDYERQGQGAIVGEPEKANMLWLIPVPVRNGG